MDIQSKIDFSISVNQLFKELNPQPQFTVSRYQIAKYSKDVYKWLKIFRLTGENIERWKEYKNLFRDLPGYKFEPNISELEDLKELLLKKQNPPPPLSKPVFNDTLLSEVYKAFEYGDIWENITMVEFIESFHGNGNKIKPIVQADFCYLLGLMESKKSENFSGDFSKWVENTFGIKRDSYKGQKKYNPNNQKRINIKQKFDSLM